MGSRVQVRLWTALLVRDTGPSVYHCRFRHLLPLSSSSLMGHKATVGSLHYTLSLAACLASPNGRIPLDPTRPAHEANRGKQRERNSGKKKLNLCRSLLSEDIILELE